MTGSSRGPYVKWALWGVVVFAAATSAKANGELEGQADAIPGVNGHILGGYLATAFTRLFGASALEVNTFNSADFGDAATGNIQSEFRKIETLLGTSALGMGSFGMAGVKQTNGRAGNAANDAGRRTAA